MASNSLCGEAEMSAIVSSAALVSEPIVDSSPLVYMSRGGDRKDKSSSSELKALDGRGISHHSFSRQRIKKLLSSSCEQRESTNTKTISIHPARYHAYMAKKQRLKGRDLQQYSQMLSHSDSKLHSSAKDSTVESSHGIIASAKQWLSDKKGRRERLTLSTKEGGQLVGSEQFMKSSDTVMSDGLILCGASQYFDDENLCISGGRMASYDDYNCNGREVLDGQWSSDTESFHCNSSGIVSEEDTKPMHEEHERIIIQEEDQCLPSILSEDQMMTIAKRGLPACIVFSKWTRLYSLVRDGDSFECFLRKVQGQTRTLLVIRTTKDEIMGAYSHSPWENAGQIFYGSAQACLFSIDSETCDVRVFKWSGANRYIQLCDVHTKMIAFGGGGDKGEFGLCIENNFSIGSTGTCETFRNDPLCRDDRFEVLNVECWGFSTAID